MATKRSHLSPRTRAYTKVGAWALELQVGLNPDLADDDRPPSEHLYGWKPIWLMLAGPARRVIHLHLTGMTVEELEAFQRMMTIAVEEALTIASDLDRQAIEVMMSGDDDIPIRALASAPPWFDRPVSLRYESPE